MYALKENIVYPMHGVGIVEGIEETACGAYYIIHIPMGNVKIRILKESLDTIGVRALEERGVVAETIEKVGVSRVKCSENWTLRYKENFSKLKTGKLEMVAEVIKVLQEQGQKKQLSTAESRLLSLAKQIILSEIAISYETNSEMAEKLLAKWLGN